MRKKPIFLILVFLLIAFISGCGSEGNIHSSPEPIKTELNEVIDRHGQVENLERLDTFVEKVQANSKDQIRLIRYTIEGDPIYHDLDFDGSILTFTHDSTEDQYGNGEVTSYQCKSLSKQESDTETKYVIEGCSNGLEGELLSIAHDVEKEDYFAFELNYGVNKENQIDTKEQVLTKQLHNGETMTISDFQMSTEQMNRIYKQMVYANYLQPKSLSTTCKDKSYGTFELNVWINSATKSFEWTSCDQSEDGREMTALVEQIISIAEEKL
jgi:hypothetical protein